MFLSKLEIQGFKSFADKTVLEFNRSLTAIVGPNGSGKSNIADAVRWVLGEQSLKTLRGKKAEDVIFAGSAQKARMGFAEVSMTLDNSDGDSPIDYREVVITRRIYRNGESEYLINKNKARLLDIQLLLARSNFGQRTYSIIGQGMVDAILLASPAERKEFFDEATGVRAFQIKKEQSENKLESSQKNLTQSEQLVAEIEPRLRSLTRQVKRLERKGEVEIELKSWHVKYYSFLLEDLENKTNSLSEELEKLEQCKQIENNKINDLQKQIENEQMKDTAADAFRKLQREYQKTAEEKNRLSKELSILSGREELEFVKMGKNDLLWLNRRLEELTIKNGFILEEKEAKKKELFCIEKILTNKEEENDAMQKIFHETEKEIEKWQNKTGACPEQGKEKICKHLSDLYSQQKNFLELLKSARDHLDLEKLAIKAREIMELIRELTEIIEESGQDKIGLSLKNLNEQIKELLSKKEKITLEISDCRLKIEVAKQSFLQLEEKESEIKEEMDKYKQEQFLASGSANKNDLSKMKIELETELKQTQKKLLELESDLQEFSQNQLKEKQKLIQLQQTLMQEQGMSNLTDGKISDIKIELARLETKTEEVHKELFEENMQNFMRQKNVELNLPQAQAEIGRLKNQLAIIGAIDEEAIKEYEEVKERYTFLSEQIADLRSAIESCKKIIDELNKKINDQFESAFEIINAKFQEYFIILFNGGQAKLILRKKPIQENAEECIINDVQNNIVNQEIKKSRNQEAKFEIGIEIEATPPGKRLKSLNVLSGGEKALTSIALISSIMANNPSPFVLLDEVDAALDEANSERFAVIIKELSNKTQFICVTHNRATMHHAAILYGVAMSADGVSKLLSVNMAEAELSLAEAKKIPST